MAAEQHLCCDKQMVNRGIWSPEEDAKLQKYISENNGQHGQWTTFPERAGLQRCWKSCRLRWMNYLRPEIKHGKLSSEEASLIIRLQKQYGNKWTKIAKYLPGRTDNEIKNFWNASSRKKLRFTNNDDGVGLNPNLRASVIDQPLANPNFVNSIDPIQVQQQFLGNLFIRLKSDFFDAAADRLINNPPIDEPLNLVPPADSNGKGKEVVINDHSDDFINVGQPVNGDSSFDDLLEAFSSFPSPPFSSFPSFFV